MFLFPTTTTAERQKIKTPFSLISRNGRNINGWTFLHILQKGRKQKAERRKPAEITHISIMQTGRPSKTAGNDRQRLPADIAGKLATILKR